MDEIVRRVDYYYATVPDKSGEASRILSVLSETRTNLLGFSGFPVRGRKSQLDFVPDDTAAFLKVVKRASIKISKRKKGFLVRGSDGPGSLANVMGKLTDAGVNVTSAQIVSADDRKYAGLIWVKPRDMRKATKALGAK
jgi:hypothetical protein